MNKSESPSVSEWKRIQCVRGAAIVAAGLLLLDGCAYCRPPTKEQMMTREMELHKEGFKPGDHCHPNSGADAIVGLVDILVGLF